jgi:hypothetical protein
VVRGAGIVVAVQGLAALGVAVAYLIRGFAGADQSTINSFGTSGLFVVIGAALLAAGGALWTGRRWGRGVAVFAQLLLLPVAWYLMTSSQPGFGVPLGVLALGTLVTLFSAPALRWAAYQPDSASSNSDRPDSR